MTTCRRTGHKKSKHKIGDQIIVDLDPELDDDVSDPWNGQLGIIISVTTPAISDLELSDNWTLYGVQLSNGEELLLYNDEVIPV